MPRRSPLTDSDYETINQQLRDAAALREDLAKAKQAGLDCGEHDQICQLATQRLEQLKRVYFPDRP